LHTPFKFTQLLFACQTACCMTAPLLHPHHPATCRTCSPRLGGGTSAAPRWRAALYQYVVPSIIALSLIDLIF
jgi:hypothetical protein